MGLTGIQRGKTRHERLAEIIGPTVLAHLDANVKYAPDLALEFASEALSDVDFAKCLEAEPEVAFTYAAWRLSNEQIEKYAEKVPVAAMKYAVDRLSPKLHYKLLSLLTRQARLASLAGRHDEVVSLLRIAKPSAPILSGIAGGHARSQGAA